MPGSVLWTRYSAKVLNRGQWAARQLTASLRSSQTLVLSYLNGVSLCSHWPFSQPVCLWASTASWPHGLSLCESGHKEQWSVHCLFALRFHVCGKRPCPRSFHIVTCWQLDSVVLQGLGCCKTETEAMGRGGDDGSSHRFPKSGHIAGGLHESGLSLTWGLLLHLLET